MSSLWTPGGERPVPRPDDPATRPGPSRPEPGPAGPGPSQLSEAEVAAEMARLRDELASTPAEVVVANHAYGLFELAALHLSLDPPGLEQARLAVDALAALLEGLGGRLGQAEAELRDGLAQLRLVYVQISGAAARAQTGST